GLSIVWLWHAAEEAKEEALAARDRQARLLAFAERARNAEKSARAVAEKAREGAEKAREGETRARAEAGRQREKFERFEYGRTIQVAHQEWEDHNVSAALALLDRTRPDLRGWEWRYVYRLCHPELLTLYGHSGGLSSASFSPDGSRIVTAS